MKGYIARKTVSFQKAILQFGNTLFNGSHSKLQKMLNVVLQG